MTDKDLLSATRHFAGSTFRLRIPGRSYEANSGARRTRPEFSPDGRIEFELQRKEHT
jgi:hypothetical protein